MILRKFIVLLLYLLTTGIVFFVFIIYPGINGYSRAMFPDMVSGKAYKPFVYRTLLPTTIRVIAENTPEYVKDRITLTFLNADPQSKRTKMMRALGWEPEYAYEYLISLSLMFCCFLGFVFMLRFLVRSLYDFPTFIGDLAPLGGMLLLPLFFKYYSYIYDPSTLFFFTLAIFMIVKRRLSLFYPVFVLSTLNKETSILLLGIFLIREFKLMRKSLMVIHLVLLTLAWIVLRISLMVIFQENPGSLLEFHLFQNLSMILRPFELLYFVIVILVFSILIQHQWNEKPKFIRQGFFIIIIPLFLLTLFFGGIFELRDYYEAYPFLFLLLLPTVVDVLKLQENSKPGDKSQNYTD